MSTRMIHTEGIELSMLDIEGGSGPAADLKPGAKARNFPNELSAACPHVRSLTSEQTRHDEAVALSPIDGGARAWTFVFCSVILDSLVWGFPFRCVVPQNPSELASWPQLQWNHTRLVILFLVMVFSKSGTSATRHSSMPPRLLSTPSVPSRWRSNTARASCCNLSLNGGRSGSGQ
jgi:hypothetical protein